MNESKRISLRNVAAEAGVNRATVSRALRHHPSLPPETRRRIQEIARRMGYRVNPLVSTIMSHARSERKGNYLGTLAYITAGSKSGDWKSDPTHRRYFAGAMERAIQTGYRLEEFWLKEPGMTARRLSEILHARGISGLIVAPLPFPPPRGHLSLDWSHFAAVALGYSLWRPNLDRVASHHGNNIVLAVHQLRRLGYRRIGLALLEGLDERLDQNLVASFLSVQRGMKAADRGSVVQFQKHGEREFARWFRVHRPDTVVSFGGPVLPWMRNLGLKIPGQVGFVELDLSDASGSCAGIDQHSEKLVAAAVDLVVGQLHRSEYGVPALPKLILMEGSWVNGATVRSQKHQS